MNLSILVLPSLAPFHFKEFLNHFHVEKLWENESHCASHNFKLPKSPKAKMVIKLMGFLVFMTKLRDALREPVKSLAETWAG